jgi:hypothetical protein
MVFARSFMLGVAAAVLISVAGCATSTRPTGLANAAEQLDTSSRAFAAQSDTVGPPYEAAAHELAKRADDFRSMVETATVSSADVSAQFDLVAQSYHKVRADTDHARIQQLYSALEPVTAAYRNVQRQLGIAPEAEVETGG